MSDFKISGNKIFIDNTILEKQQALLFLEAFRKMKEHLQKNPNDSGVKKIVVENKMFDFNVGGKVGVASVFSQTGDAAEQRRLMGGIEILTRDELDALEMNERFLK